MDSAQLHVGSGEHHTNWVVAEDPKGKWWEGSLVDRDRARSLASKGVVLLPVQPEYFRLSGCGGYFRRSWGSGYPLSRTVPMFHAPITLALDTTKVQKIDTGVVVSVSEVHWRARLAPQGDQPHDRTGTIRMAGDSGQALARYAPVVPGTSLVIAVDRLGEPDPGGGWLVGGKMQVSAPAPGHYGFSLYGVAPGLAIVWVAASVVLAHVGA